MNYSPILICTNRNEKSTDVVLEYIDYLGGTFYRIHKEDMIKDISDNLGLNVKDCHIELKLKNNLRSILYALPFG